MNISKTIKYSFNKKGVKENYYKLINRELNVYSYIECIFMHNKSILEKKNCT